MRPDHPPITTRRTESAAAAGAGLARDEVHASAGVAFRGAVALMALLAALKLTDETLRLAWRSGRTAAIDLKLRHGEVHAWFAGLPVYGAMRDAVYPPATEALLWPFLGWLPLQPSRWLWAATAGAALVAMAWLVVRESGATGAWQRAFAALMLLAMNQTGVAVGNGQLVLHVLPPLAVGLLLLHRGRASLPEDLAAAACMVFALVKITLAVPFLWLVLLAPAAAPMSSGASAAGGTGSALAPVADGTDASKGARSWRVRPALLVAAGYVALTLFAASFQPTSLPRLLEAWLHSAQRVAAGGGDYANVHTWLSDAGLARLMLPASAVIFVALGAWLYRCRDTDLWIRLGVVALVARFWTYHRLYDDVLVIMALVALFRIATSAAGDARVGIAPGRGAAGSAGRRDRVLAAWLLGATMLAMLLPARLGTAPRPWNLIFIGSHTLTWLGVLAFLAWRPLRRPPA